MLNKKLKVINLIENKSKHIIKALHRTAITLR